MSDSKSTVRFVGYRSLPEGGRRYDFDLIHGCDDPTHVAIDASSALFNGPGHIAIQEAVAICYETLKFRVESGEASPPKRFDLTANDVAQHRRSGKEKGRGRL